MVISGVKINAVILVLLGLNVFIPAALGLSFSLEPQPELGQLRDFKGSELCQVAENSKHYLQSQRQDTFAVHPGKQIDDKITLKRVEDTLAFICQTYREDVRAKRHSRLHDTAFLKQHFEFVRWRPDKETATKIAGKSTNETKARMLNNIPDEEIFLTKYYTKLLDGSPVKTQHYDQALYALPEDEQGLSLAQAELQKAQLTRFRFTRQQIIAGALEKDKRAKPLVWLTEEALHDVLLQGTGVLKVDGKIRYFNVHRNNGIAYDYSIGKREQPRYWYFVETPEIMGYGHDQPSKIAIKPQVTFAGNIAELGVGKLIMVSYRDNKGQVSRLGILADQGGAFDNNLFQLDLLVDSYRGWSDYHSYNGHLPDYARAWILLLK
ncbi:MltA domain-containing protein [Thalassomonas sp. RHCl1]|uniref:MltA domain-containing protein n=1 Tax=Thalassomonas sp. RHCl1 TaxID=2995320 RepID=UPI00248B56B0|nr:MltA domain-containing protein [Thalassomonas sp. RHCl1]